MHNTYNRLFWYTSNNFGDNLNHLLMTELSGLPVIYAYERNTPHYILCGSILAEANEHSIVCGAGLGNKYQKINQKAKIISVRGNLSKELCGKGGSDMPVADPCLFLPSIYSPNEWRGSRYEKAIIPHWSDYAFFLNMKESNDLLKNVHIIDPFLPVKEFVDEIHKCERVISAGLHGLIACDAYNIPNAWLDLGNKDEFKFLDYYSTTETYTHLSAIDFSRCQVNKYRYNLSKVLVAYPFFPKYE